MIAVAVEVVSGHIIGPILKKDRTNLDTFASHTGRLVIGVFDDDTPGGPLEILETQGRPAVQAARLGDFSGR